MIGAAPATEAKWWPSSTARCVGTESMPSLCMTAGTGSSPRRPKTRLASIAE